MTTEIWITLAAANFAAYLAPGQNMALVGAATARSGLAGGLAATSGILVAEFIWTAIALALTLTARDVDTSAMLAIRLGGGVLLVWLGFRVLKTPSTTSEQVVAASTGRLRLAATGVWIGLANPMALIFFVSIFPSLISVSGPRAPLDLLALCGTAVILSSLAALAPYLAVSQALVRAGQTQLLNAVSGGALLLMGVVTLALTAA